LNATRVAFKQVAEDTDLGHRECQRSAQEQKTTNTGRPLHIPDQIP